MRRNKEMCERCKYHGYIGHSRELGKQEACCLYSTKAFRSAMGRDGLDRRGKDPDKCNLFEAGDPDRVGPKCKKASNKNNWG
jgi:hypothetical protein